MFEDIIVEQNRHWSGTLYAQGIERRYFPKLLEYLATGMIISIIGVSLAGKSTLLKQTINYLIQHKRVGSDDF